jgi:hypothetical protein
MLVISSESYECSSHKEPLVCAAALLSFCGRLN